MIPARPKIAWSLAALFLLAAPGQAQTNTCDYEFDARTRAILRLQREKAAQPAAAEGCREEHRQRQALGLRAKSIAGARVPRQVQLVESTRGTS